MERTVCGTQIGQHSPINFLNGFRFEGFWTFQNFLVDESSTIDWTFLTGTPPEIWTISHPQTHLGKNTHNECRRCSGVLLRYRDVYTLNLPWSWEITWDQIPNIWYSNLYSANYADEFPYTQDWSWKNDFPLLALQRLWIKICRNVFSIQMNWGEQEAH